MRGDGRVYRRGRIWWLYYWHRGIRHLESAGTGSKTKAAGILREKLASLSSGRSVADDPKFSVGDALDAYLVNLGLRRGPRAVETIKTHEKPLRAALGLDRAGTLTPERVDAYVRDRLAGG